MKKSLSFLNFADDNEKRLVSRVLESAEKNGECEYVLPLFLNLREQKMVRDALPSVFSSAFTFFGGFKTGERRVLVLFPEYIMFTSLLEPGYVSADSEDIRRLCLDATEGILCALRIKCSEFEKLTHRDYMGALLALGIERSTLGDIVLASPHEAYVIATAKIGEFICDSLTSVGRASVSCELVRDYSKLGLSHATSESVCVATSLRLDCVISAITGISREKSKALVSAGQAELNYYSKASPDDTVNDGDVISVRGYGKYKIADTSAKTSKGKNRLTVLKYI